MLKKNFQIFLISCTIYSQVYDVSIPEDDSASYNYADFRLWINDSTDTLKGLYWFMHPNNGDSRNIVSDTLYQNLVKEQDFALLGAHIFNMNMDTGIGDAVITAMDSFAILSGHQEIAFIPFFINGYSWGGQFGYHFAKWIPERVLGLVTQKGGYHDTTDAGPAIEVPALMIVGEEDLDYRIDNLTGIFYDHRNIGAKWILAMEPGAGHTQVTDYEFLNSFYNTITDLRLDNNTNVYEPISLNTIPDSIGWLGNQITYRIGSWDCYDGNFDSSSWFPSKTVGEYWQNFNTDFPTDTSVCDLVFDSSYVFFTVGIHGMDDETDYIITTNTNDLISLCRSQLELSVDDRMLHINGYLDYGHAGFNAPWNWHIIPNDWTLAEMSIGVCNGNPEDVEENLDYWINDVGQLCNWGSFIKDEIETNQNTNLSVIYISINGSNSTGNGSLDSPFATIQKGLDESTIGDTILVESGTYVENIIWPQTYGIKLIGSGQENCIIDGDSTGRVISFIDSLDNIIDTNTALTGFTIQNGYSDFDDTGEKPGGGIYCVNASPMITDCKISQNHAYGEGGGIALINGSHAICSNLEIHNNSAKGSSLPGVGMRYRGKGGGILIVQSDPIFTNVQITGNYAGEYGAGLYILYSSPIFRNFIISGNGGSGILQKGGGILCESTPSARFIDGEIYNNGNNEIGSAPYIGGGIFVGSAPFDSLSSFHTQLINVNIYNNYSRMWGGGIAGSGISISGGTIRENSASHFGGGLYVGGDPSNLGNIEFSSINRSSVYSNTVEDSNITGNDIYSELFLDIILDTFTVINPTEYHTAPIDNFTFDILTGLDNLSNNNDEFPSEMILYPPYPNPFNPITTIQFEIPQNDDVKIKIYNLTGRVIERFVNKKIKSGYNTIHWNASSQSTGIYFFELTTKKNRAITKLLLMK
ncbi:MAG: T9SS type A sorting domain-containing protein [Candidatus Neomarinimicrobiota bacterium]